MSAYLLCDTHRYLIQSSEGGKILLKTEVSYPEKLASIINRSEERNMREEEGLAGEDFEDKVDARGKWI